MSSVPTTETHCQVQLHDINFTKRQQATQTPPSRLVAWSQQLYSADMAAPANPFRTYAITGAVASITAVGAWYGAGLKARQEYKQVNRIRCPPEHTTSVC